MGIHITATRTARARATLTLMGVAPRTRIMGVRATPTLTAEPRRGLTGQARYIQLHTEQQAMPRRITHPQRITDTTHPLLWVTTNRGATTAATDHRLGLPPRVLWRAWL